MNRLRVALWVLVAWALPAAIAGALGWRGVWGSGSAGLDYLIPIPVAGGVLHVPSFVVTTLAVSLAPRFGATGLQRWRALLLGLGMVGAMLTFKGPGLRLTENPLGLFLLSDAVLALGWLAFAPQRPWIRADLLSLILLLAPIAVLAWVAWGLSPRSRDFNVGTAQPYAAGHAVTIFVQTRLGPDSARFRTKALAWAAAQQHPRQWLGVDEAALYFSLDRLSAISGDRSQVFATLCQYVDGRAPRWLPGAGDCFGGAPLPGAPDGMTPR
jgi:hypothetical protein